jgi:hypothetical protein
VLYTGARQHPLLMNVKIWYCYHHHHHHRHHRRHRHHHHRHHHNHHQGLQFGLTAFFQKNFRDDSKDLGQVPSSSASSSSL